VRVRVCECVCKLVNTHVRTQTHVHTQALTHARTHTGAATVARVEQALLWTEPWLSARALGGGLYLIVCVQQAVQGVCVACGCGCGCGVGVGVGVGVVVGVGVGVGVSVVVGAYVCACTFVCEYYECLNVLCLSVCKGSKAYLSEAFKFASKFVCQAAAWTLRTSNYRSAVAAHLTKVVVTCSKAHFIHLVHTYI